MEGWGSLGARGPFYFTVGAASYRGRVFEGEIKDFLSQWLSSERGRTSQEEPWDIGSLFGVFHKA